VALIAMLVKIASIVNIAIEMAEHAAFVKNKFASCLHAEKNN
jgi:hypothetical protein